MRSLPEIQAVNAEHNRLIIEEHSNFFARYNPNLTPSNSPLIAKIVFEVICPLQTQALMNPEEAPQIIAEMKTLLLRYLEPYLTNTLRITLPT